MFLFFRPFLTNERRECEFNQQRQQQQRQQQNKTRAYYTFVRPAPQLSLVYLFNDRYRVWTLFSETRNIQQPKQHTQRVTALLTKLHSTQNATLLRYAKKIRYATPPKAKALSRTKNIYCKKNRNHTPRRVFKPQ